MTQGKPRRSGDIVALQPHPGLVFHPLRVFPRATGGTRSPWNSSSIPLHPAQSRFGDFCLLQQPWLNPFWPGLPSAFPVRGRLSLPQVPPNLYLLVKSPLPRPTEATQGVFGLGQVAASDTSLNGQQPRWVDPALDLGQGWLGWAGLVSWRERPGGSAASLRVLLRRRSFPARFPCSPGRAVGLGLAPEPLPQR